MDRVGDMLFEQVSQRYAGAIRADRIRPELKRKVTALGILGGSRVAWNADRLWNRMVEYPRWLRRERGQYDIFHIVDHSYAHLALELPGERTVITCHDLFAFRWLTEPAKEPRPRWFRAMAGRVVKGLQSAAQVIFVSHAVREEALRLGLVTAERSRVIPNGVDADAGRDEEAVQAADELLETDPRGESSGRPLLLNVGSTVARKRIDVLLRVFAGVLAADPGARLVRVGGPMTAEQRKLAGQLGITRSIVELPFLDRDVLAAVYRRAALVLQPSDAEGFGLPIAEGMAYGRTVVTSNLPVQRETGGEAAVYCPPGDVLAWTATVTRLLKQRREDPVGWAERQERSIANARRFRWQDSVDRTVDVYREVLTSS